MKLSKDEKSILKGILLGDKSEIDEEIVTDFSESNISHILAISGLHVSYIILAITKMLEKTQGRKVLLAKF